MDANNTQDTYESLASLIDWHLLRPETPTETVAEACGLAAEAQIRCLVVRPIDVEAAVRFAGRSGVTVGSAAGYPDGISTTATKLYELREVLRLGAKEVDFVLSPSKLLDRQFQHIETELLQASRSCAESGAALKVVYQNRYLPNDIKIIATKICRRVEAGMIAVDYSEADTALLQPLLKERLLMKCATPVDSLPAALAAKTAGYARIAVENPLLILEAWKQQLAAQQTPSPVSS